jgi:Phage protein D
MIKQPKFRLIYNGVDITSAFDMWPTEVEYTDKRHGESDEATVKVHNTGGRWFDDWAPEEGIKFKLWYGYEGNLVYAGEFTVSEDEAEGDTSGDTVNFKGLAAPNSQALRTKNHTAYEQQSLKEIVNKVAQKHNLKVEGEIEDIQFERVTQNGERDLEFLKRLADDYGHYFTVKGGRLVFTSRDGLRARDPVRILDLEQGPGAEIIRYSLKNSDYKAAQKAKVKYHHAKRKKIVGAEASTVDDLGLTTASGDVVKIDVRVENTEQARRVAKSRLDKKNAAKVSGEFELVGDPLLVAGQVIELKNFGKWDGRWLITKSKHSMKRSGYTTAISIERITDKQRENGKAIRSKAKKAGKSGGSSGDNVDDLGVMNENGVLKK